MKLNTWRHKKYFDTYSDTEWHFFATSHGKGPCDRVGGTLKRTAALVSLQRPLENPSKGSHMLHSCIPRNPHFHNFTGEEKKTKINYTQAYGNVLWNVIIKLWDFDRRSLKFCRDI